MARWVMRAKNRSTWLSQEGWREVNMPTRTAGEPSSDLWMLVGGVVVDDEMDVQPIRHIGFDVTYDPHDYGGVCTGR